jgi:glutamate synthase (NADPH) small chain
MTNSTAFLDIKRRVASLDEAGERLRHFREFHQALPTATLQEQAERCMGCGTPFCHGAGCPLGNLIPECNALAAQGRWQEACERLHLANNFPEFTGRICPALCEAACVNALDGEAVAIGEIELAIVERGWDEGWIRPRPPARETGKRVAVIGSGPAGLTAAQQLRRAGHAVTVFERADKPGGLLRHGIPDFKLAKRVLDRRLEQLRAEGVRFELRVDAGVDLTAGYFRKKFDAVSLCAGSGVARDLDVPGRDAAGVHLGFLLVR